MVMGRVNEVLYLQSRVNSRLNLGRLNNMIHTERGRFIRDTVKSILPEAQKKALSYSSRCTCNDCFSEVIHDWSFLLTVHSPYRKIFASRFKGKRRSVKVRRLTDFVTERIGHEYETIFNSLNSETPAPALHSDT